MLKRKPKVLTPEQVEEIRTKDFFDMILPGTIKFLSDHYIVGDSYRCVWAIREYPPSTEEQAILSQLADRNGVTLRIYHRLVESMEQRKIIQNATRRNRLKSGGNDVNETIEAEGNLQDVIELLANLRKNKEPLLHVSVFIELKARSIAAENGNDYAEYQLGKIYLYGKDVPRDTDKAMYYLHLAAEHGNQYAAQLIHSIRVNGNWTAALASLRLLGHMARVIQNRLEDERKGRENSIDRKLRRKVEDKKQAHGLKQ